MLVTIGHFFDPMEAHILRARLESEGIPATVADDLLVTANWPWSVALGGAKLQVPREDEAQAREILAAYASGELASDVELETGTGPEACPDCGSTELERSVPASQKLFALGLFAISSATFPTRTSSLRCKSCGHRWQS